MRKGMTKNHEERRGRKTCDPRRRENEERVDG